MWEKIGGQIFILSPERYHRIDWLTYVCYLVFLKIYVLLATLLAVCCFFIVVGIDSSHFGFSQL